MSHVNLMMIGFVRNEMTLKTTLLLYDPIVIDNALVSCVTSLEKRFQPLITLTIVGVIFSTNEK
jgi:hypothetical protein